MSKIISITHVCETAKGGIATYLRLIGTVMADSTKNSVILPDSQRQEIGRVMQPQTFPDSGRGMTRLWRLFRCTRAHVRAAPPDILFFHSTFTLPILAALRMLGIRARAIYCAHGWAALRYPTGSLKHRLVAMIEGRLCGLADIVLNISHYDHQYAVDRRYQGRHRVLENAVIESEGTTVPAPFSREEPTINLLFVGRFDRQKGLDILLNAFAVVRRRRPDMVLHVVGGAVLGDHPGLGPESAPDGVVFHGWQSPPHLQGFYESADLVVVPSRWEGFGLVVPEALRAGTPVMVSDRGALPGLIDHGRTGFIIPLAVKNFIQALGGLKKTELAAMRPACRLLYEQRFQARRFRQELEQIYYELCNDAPK